MPYNFNVMRRRFFLTSFVQYLLLLLVPILIFSTLFIWIVNGKVTSMIEDYTQSLFSISSLNIENIFDEMLQTKIYIESKSDVHIALFQVLEEENPSPEALATLALLSQYQYTILNTKFYIQSLYIGKLNSPYAIVNGERKKGKDMIDQGWYESAQRHEKNLTTWIETRTIRQYSFETKGVPVISIYQRTKYNEIIVVNLYRSYFTNLLDSIAHLGKEALWVSDEEGRILFESRVSSLLEEPIKRSSFAQSVALKAKGMKYGDYYLTSMKMDRYNLRFISLIPNDLIYATPLLLKKTTFFVAIMATILSLVLAIMFTRESYLKVSKIVAIFEKNLQEKLLFDFDKKGGNAYFYILESATKMFVNNANLRVELTERQYELLSAKFAALQYQINPHFIFNTLQAIDLEIINATGVSVQANKMVNQFAEIMRYSLGNPTTLVPLRQEIAMARTYISMNQYRIGKRFQVIWDYDEEECDSLPVIRLIFQPLIENAISHALLPDGKLTLVRIRIKVRGDYLHVSVVDNGQGIPPAKLAELRERLNAKNTLQEDQVGLKNVSNRLILQYDESCRIKVYSIFGHGIGLFFRIGISPEDFPEGGSRN